MKYEEGMERTVVRRKINEKKAQPESEFLSLMQIAKKKITDRLGLYKNLFSLSR